MAPTTPMRDEIIAALAAEQAALAALLPTINDQQWHTLQRSDGWTIHDIVGHIADSTYGIPRLLAAGPQPGGSLNIDDRNEQRRQRMRELPRAELEQLVGSGFDAAREALANTTDLSAPGPYGPNRTVGDWFALIPMHNAGHRKEIEELLGI